MDNDRSPTGEEMLAEMARSRRPLPLSIGNSSVLKSVSGMGGAFGRVDNPFATLLGGIRAKRSLTNAANYVYVNDPQLYDLYYEMASTCPWIKAALAVVSDQIQQNAWSFRLDETDPTPQAQALLELVQDCLSPKINELISSLFMGAAQDGFSMVENIWEIDAAGNCLITEFRHQHPGLFCFDEQGHPLLYRTGARLPAYKFIRCTSPCMYSLPAGESLLNSLIVPWQSWQNAWISINDLLGRYGMPIVICKMAGGFMGEQSDAVQDQQRMMLQLQTTINSLSETSSGLVLPSGVELEFKDRAIGSSTQPHFDAMDKSIKELVTVIVGSTLGFMESEYGTRAQAEVHASTGSRRAKNWALRIEQAINKSAVDPFVALNWRGGTDTTPKIKFNMDVTDPTDLTWIQAGYALAEKLGLPVSRTEFYEVFDMQTPADDDAVIIQAPGMGGGPAPFADDLGPSLGTPELPAEPALPPPPPDVLPVNADEACKIVGRSKGWLREAVKSGLIPDAAYRAGARIVYNPVALREWRDNQMIRPAGKEGETMREGCCGDSASDDESDRGTGLVLFSEDLRSERIESQTRDQLFALTAGTADALEREVAKLIGKAIQDNGKIKKGTVYKPSRDIEDAMIAAALVGVASSFRQFKSQLNSPKSVEFAEPSDLPSYWKRGAEWMATRGGVPKSKLSKIIAQFMAALAASIVPSARVVEQSIRDRVLAIAGAVSSSVVGAIRDSLAKGIAAGSTAREMADILRAEADAGKLPGVARNTIDTIARTEQANALEAQRAEIEALPIIRDNLLGYRYSNPNDSRTRPSHSALVGSFFPLDSDELKALGRGPFSYNCRCLMVPVLRIPGRAIPVKTAGLAGNVSKLERF